MLEKRLEQKYKLIESTMKQILTMSLLILSFTDHIDTQKTKTTAMLMNLFLSNFKNYIKVTLVIMLIYGNSFAGNTDFDIKTFTYKYADNLEIKADVYGNTDNTIRPVVVWIHGGALILGHRKWVDKKMISMLLEEGYLVVSIDYRLAPITKLPLIIEDIEDAFLWIQKDGKELFGADASRIAVMGSSAGGYLTLTSGFRVVDRPKALVSFYGYGDLIGDWYSTPSKHQRHQGPQMSTEEAWNQVRGLPITDSRNRDGNGSSFYKYCRRNGFWPEAVSGWNPHTEPQNFFPYMPIKNITSEYPPTMLIHGTDDTDVPYEQSVIMVQKLNEVGIPNKLISISGAEHSLKGGDKVEIAKAYELIIKFLNGYMKT